MSKRLQHLQKKKIQQENKEEEETPSYQTTPSYNTKKSEAKVSRQPSSTNKNTKQEKMPRPQFPSANQFHVYDRNDYKKNEFAFPPPESLMTQGKINEPHPKLIRTTSSVICNTPKKVNLPLGAWISPLGHDKIHTVDVNAPLRCSRCKTYVNPYFIFDGSRRAAVCNICGIKFNIDDNVDKNNINSSEINTFSVVDFRVKDKFYFKKRTDIVKVIFAIEMSMPMMELGIFGTAVESIRSALENGEYDENVRMGFVIYGDNGVNFFRFPKAKRQKSQQQQKEQQEEQQQQPEPMVFNVPNNKNNMFCCPLSDHQYLLNPNTEKQKIASLLSFIDKLAETTWKESKFSNTANYVSAVKCIKDGFENQTGRIILFSLLDPRQGLCSIRPRKQQQTKNLMKPITNEFQQLAKQLVKARIGIEHFIFTKDPHQNHELVTTHYLSTLTGGSLYFYSLYNPQLHSDQLYYLIFKTINKNVVYDVDFTCRVSNGLGIMRYGAFQGIRESRDVGLSMIDDTSSISVEIQHQEKIEESGMAFLQFAMMFTTGSGQRRIRVINYKFEVNPRIESVYQSSDYLTFANILLRNQLSKLPKSDPLKLRQETITMLANHLAEYRNKYPGWQNQRYSELPIHTSLSWSLAYIHSILNSKIFLGGLQLTPDFKINEMLKWMKLNFYGFAMKAYPKLYSLGMEIYDSDILPGDFIENQQEEQQSQKIAILPDTLPLSRSYLKDDGLYLFVNDQNLQMLVQPHTAEELLLDVFETSSWQQIQTNPLPELETSHNIRIHNIIEQIRRRHTENGGAFLSLKIWTPLKKGPYGDIIHSVVKEDYVEMGYFRFLDELHRATQLVNK